MTCGWVFFSFPITTISAILVEFFKELAHIEPLTIITVSHTYEVKYGIRTMNDAMMQYLRFHFRHILNEYLGLFSPLLSRKFGPNKMNNRYHFIG